MNKNFQPNFEAATLSLPTESDGTKRQISCLFHGVEGKRLRLASPEPVGLATAISLEHDDALFLGEVILCRQTTQARFEIEVRVEQVLTGLQSLMILRARLLGESVPEPAAVRFAGVYA